jgi:hypothetical protein
MEQWKGRWAVNITLNKEKEIQSMTISCHGVVALEVRI